MDTLSKFFDHYLINARLQPAFFVTLPLVATILAWYPEAREIGGFVVTVLITFGVLGFLSVWISKAGNTLQEKLFAEWGGLPSIALLRFSDTTLDHHTKQRYRQRLEVMIPGLKFPSPERELADPVQADNTYASATNFLRECTRDKKRYSMIYSDCVAYGYARNLLAIKGFGLLASFVALLTNIVLLYSIVYSKQIGMEYFGDHPILYGATAAAVSLVLLLIFMFAINKEYVRGRAIRYAKSLLAVCEAYATSSSQQKAESRG